MFCNHLIKEEYKFVKLNITLLTGVSRETRHPPRPRSKKNDTHPSISEKISRMIYFSHVTNIVMSKDGFSMHVPIHDHPENVQMLNSIMCVEHTFTYT